MASSSSSSPSKQAIEWVSLRKRSLVPGGFGSERVEIWPQLLGVSPVHPRTAESLSTEDDSEENLGEEPRLEPHRDERQIRLDTDRSFVLYPTSSPDKEVLQGSLHALIVSVFRKRPKLNYFQGYHDIISVLFLTLPPDLQFACAEKLSLHKIRDSMGSTLEPVLGLLRVTKNLLRLADPKYAETLEQTSPLPFHALSNLLTLFSHDMPTLPLIQHVFDYLLCRPPIAIVYLATAVILSRKSDVERLMTEDEHEGGMGIGMAHSLLNALPDISDNAPEAEVAVKKEERVEDEGIAVASGAKEDYAVSETTKLEVRDAITRVEDPDQEMSIEQEDDLPDGILVDKGEPAADQPFADGQPIEFGADARASTSMELEDEYDTLEQEESTPSESRTPESSKHSEDDPPSTNSPTTTTPSRSRSPSRSSPVTPAQIPLPSSAPSRRTSSSTTTSSTPLTLSSLLINADTLYGLYPPAHPGLRLSSIMGPQSVVYTWREPGPSDGAMEREREGEELADDEAEAMVACPGLVVYPYIEEDDDIDVDVDQTSEEEGGWVWWSEKKKTVPNRKMKSKEKAGKGNQMRRPRKLRRNPFSRLERRTVLAGMVLVLGVAMAVYGTSNRGSGTGWNGYRRGWRVGSAFVGVANRVVAWSGVLG